MDSFRLLTFLLLAAWLPVVAPGQTTAVFDSEAAESSGEMAALTIYWENDGGVIFPNSDNDRHYTNGAGFSIAYRPEWAERLAEVMPGRDAFGPARTAAGFTAAQLIFTPENLMAQRPLPDDRPYAGYLYGGVFWQRATDVGPYQDATVDHVQLDLGIVGPSSRAEDIQEFIHRHFEGDDPMGWDNQLDDEPTIQFWLRKRWRLDMGSVDLDGLGDAGALRAQLIPYAELAVGTVYRHVEGGALVRLGFNLPDDFGPGSLQDLGSFTGGPQTGWGGYGFVGVAGRVTEHNLFIEGSEFQDSLGVDAEPLTGELTLGLAATYRQHPWTFEAAYRQTYFTQQFDGQEGRDEIAAVTLQIRRDW